jgi:hypothetical protein
LGLSRIEDLRTGRYRIQNQYTLQPVARSLTEINHQIGDIHRQTP